jgi:hypothetical protein
MSIIVPDNQNLTIGLTPPNLGGQFAWLSSDITKGTILANNDGTSALFVPVAAGSTTISVSNKEGAPWLPGKLYRLGDQILDSNLHIRQVTAGSKLIPNVYTPEDGLIPQGGEGTYFVELTLTAAANASGGTTVYTVLPTNAAGALNGFAGLRFRVAGFVANVANNGQFLCVASTSGSVTLVNASGVLETIAAIAKSIGVASDPNGYARVLNQGDGDINGDWPAGALAPAGSDTNLQGKLSSNSNLRIPTSAAPVVITGSAWIAGGYSRGRNAAGQDNSPAGIDTPTSYGNDSRVQIAEYSEIGVGGQKVYIDAAGNTQTGWQVAKGTQTFSEPSGQPPVWVNGVAMVDGDLVWTDEGAAADADVWEDLVLVVTSGAVQIPYNFLLMARE